MPLCPQITNTPITVTLTADFTVTDVVPVVPATTEDVANVVVLVDGKTKAYYQTTAPTSGMTEGDIWFDTDDGYKLYYYTGSAWTSVQDTSIAAAQSAATAAQTTADGKNKIYRQTTMPTTGPFSEGDLWFDTDDDNRFYRYTSGAFSAFSLGNNAIASLSATKLTAGTIDASVITVSNINAGNISTGTLAAARIATGSLDASKITAGTITATQISSSYVYAGTIAAGNITTGTLSATVSLAAVSGTIGGFTLSSSSIYSSTNLVIEASGQISGGNSSTIFYGFANIGGGAATGERLIVAGDSVFNGKISAITSSFVGQMNYSGIATGSGSTMVVVTTGSRVAYTTSSERFKEQIQYINTTGWLDKVLAMQPITYKTSEDFTVEGEPNETQIGFLAEDIYDIGGGLEKAVVLDPLGDPFSLSYDRLTVFLTLAIKELKAEIDTLKGE
jgi:hypothetical protein